MSHQAKTIWKTIVTTILSGGFIAGAVLYVARIDGKVEANTIRDEGRQENLNQLVAAVGQVIETQKKQGESITKIQAYFDYGLADRLQLNKELINRQAQLMASTTP